MDGTTAGSGAEMANGADMTNRTDMTNGAGTASRATPRIRDARVAGIDANMRFAVAATAAALLLGGLAALPAHAGEATPSGPPAAADPHAHHHASPAAAAMPGDSLYQLPVHLQSASGGHVMLEQYRGEPLVVTMFYGTCKSVCPLLTRAMTATAATLPAASRDKVRFLMVTLDPERDTTAELTRFMKEYDLKSPRFEVARTDAGGVRLLAAALGIKYRQLPDGNFSHSSVLTVLDGDGVPKARTEKIAGADPEFVAATVRLVR
jgi:protein SCO1/2